MGEGIICIIPARSGSVGVKNKNIRLLNGIPLIAYAIRAAKLTNSIDRVVVSTDSTEYAKIAMSYGASVPFLRPKHLAEDVPSEDVVIHAIHQLGLPYTRAVVTLQCTTPLILPEEIDLCVKKCLQSGFDSAMTVCEISERPEWMFGIINGKLWPYRQEQEKLKGPWGVRQNHPQLYRPNGACYATRHNLLVMGKRIIGEHCAPVIMPRLRSFDIDTEEDFTILEAVLQLHPDLARF